MRVKLAGRAAPPAHEGCAGCSVDLLRGASRPADLLEAKPLTLEALSPKTCVRSSGSLLETLHLLEIEDEQLRPRSITAMSLALICDAGSAPASTTRLNTPYIALHDKYGIGLSGSTHAESFLGLGAQAQDWHTMLLALRASCFGWFTLYYMQFSEVRNPDPVGTYDRNPKRGLRASNSKKLNPKARTPNPSQSLPKPEN